MTSSATQVAAAVHDPGVVPLPEMDENSVGDHAVIPIGGRDGRVLFQQDWGPRLRKGGRWAAHSRVDASTWNRQRSARRGTLCVAAVPGTWHWYRPRGLGAGLCRRDLLAGPAANLARARSGCRTRKRGDIPVFLTEYMKSRYSDWITAKEAAAVFNEAHPLQDPVRPSSARNRLQQMVWSGWAERKEGRHPAGRAGTTPCSGGSTRKQE